MVDVTILTNLRRELAAMTIPSVTQWNRVEGRPRTAAFDQALRAEVRDGLWMLARQWQMGEFRGDDAGAPVLAQMRMDHTLLTKAKLGEDPVEPMDDPAAPRGSRRASAGSVRPRRAQDRLRPAAADGAALAEVDRGNRQPRARPSATPIRSCRPIPRARRTPTSAPTRPASPCSPPLAGRAMDGGELYLHLKSRRRGLRRRRRRTATRPRSTPQATGSSAGSSA